MEPTTYVQARSMSPMMPPAASPPEESLVADDRGRLTPAEMIERKLVLLMKNTPLPVSHLTAGRFAGRGR